METVEVREYLASVRAPRGVDLDRLMCWDLECIKVPSTTPNWPTKLRTKPIMMGYGRWVSDTKLNVQVIASDDERAFIDTVKYVMTGFDTAVYYATREYDRNVLEGRWTYARRALWDGPVNWPTFRGYNGYKNIYRNVQNAVSYRIDRVGDIASRQVIDLWPKRIKDPVFEHNKRDIIEIATFLRLLSE